jgi:hypothetical protein
MEPAPAVKVVIPCQTKPVSYPVQTTVNPALFPVSVQNVLNHFFYLKVNVSNVPQGVWTALQLLNVTNVKKIISFKAAAVSWHVLLIATNALMLKLASVACLAIILISLVSSALLAVVFA